MLSDLAVFGGPAEFDDELFVGVPNIPDRDALFARLDAALRTRWLSNGPMVREFEAAVASAAGVRHAVATCNATVALQLAMRALPLSGEVIVPSLTYAATVHALSWLGLTPVFCDVDPVTLNLDPAAAEALITPRTSGIVAVHLWGRPCAVEQLEDLARRHGLRLLLDAAHAFGCTHRNRPIGGFGDAEVFSFHATKFVNAFEGGAVVTDDDDLCARLRALRNCGHVGEDEVAYGGTNGKMTEAQAAMGLTSLESMDLFVAHYRANYRRYREGLAGVPGISLVTFEERERNNYQYIAIQVDETAAGLTRDLLQRVLHAENVHARRHFPASHQTPPYAGTASLPHTERIAARLMTLPTGTAVGPDDVERICRLIRLAVGHGAEISARLAAAPVTRVS